MQDPARAIFAQAQTDDYFVSTLNDLTGRLFKPGMPLDTLTSIGDAFRRGWAEARSDNDTVLDTWAALRDAHAAPSADDTKMAQALTRSALMQTAFFEAVQAARTKGQTSGTIDGIALAKAIVQRHVAAKVVDSVINGAPATFQSATNGGQEALRWLLDALPASVDRHEVAKALYARLAVARLNLPVEHEPKLVAAISAALEAGYSIAIERQ